MNKLCKSNQWISRPLVEVATLQRGYDLPVQDRNAGPFPIFAANGPVGFHDTAKCEGPGVVTGRSGTIGKVQFVEGDYWPLNTSLYVTDFHGNHPKWVYYMLQSFGLEKYAQGAGVPTLNRNLVHHEPVLVPPLEEQRRITAILDQAETLRTQRRTALALLDSLTQSLFLDMFGDPVTNSKGWPISNIGREAKLQGGFAFKSNDYVVNGVRLVKISNVHRDALTWDDLDYLPESYIEAYKSFNLNIGDIVIALTRPIIQSLDSVKIAVVSAIDVPSLLNQRVGRFVITQPTRLEPQYLLGFCRSKAFFNAVSKFCSESLQPNMSTAQVEGLELPLPPLPLQQTFATRIASIEALKATHRRALAALDALFASLQQRAFTGAL